MVEGETITSPRSLKTIKHGLVEQASSLVHGHKGKVVWYDVTINLDNEDIVDLEGSSLKRTASLISLKNSVVPFLWSMGFYSKSYVGKCFNFLVDFLNDHKMTSQL